MSLGGWAYGITHFKSSRWRLVGCILAESDKGKNEAGQDYLLLGGSSIRMVG